MVDQYTAPPDPHAPSKYVAMSGLKLNTASTANNAVSSKFWMVITISIL